MAKIFNFLNKDKQPPVNTMPKYKLSDIYYIEKWENDSITLIPIVFNNEESAVLDLSSQVQYQYTELDNIDKVKSVSNPLPQNMVKELSKTGELRHIYEGSQLENNSQHAVWDYEIKNDKEFASRNHTIYESKNWYTNKTATADEILNYAKIYQEYLNKEVELFNNKNFGIVKANSNIMYPYTLFSQKYMFKDIYWFVTSSLDGKKHVYPFVAVVIDANPFYMFAHNILNNSSVIKCKFANAQVTKFDIERALCKHFCCEFHSNDYKLYVGDEIERHNPCLISLKDERHSEKLKELNFKIFTIEELINATYKYKARINAKEKDDEKPLNNQESFMSVIIK